MRKATLTAFTPYALGRLCLGVAFTILTLIGTGCSGHETSNVQPPPKNTPTITWSAPAPILYGTALSATQLNATASVAGTAFVYSPAAGTVLNAGTQTLNVTFTPSDTTNYNSAIASVSLVVNKVTPTITWPAPAPITAGTALSATQLNATASVAGTFTYSPAAGTVLNAGTQTLSATFTPTDATDYTVATGSVSITVNSTIPQITAITPRYMVSDNYIRPAPTSTTYTVTATGLQNGDIQHDVSGVNGDTTLSLAPGATGYAINVPWQPGSFEPWFLTLELQHPGGPYGSPQSTAFLGTGSQSTTTVSTTTGTIFQFEQKSGQVYWKKTDGTTGTLFPSNITTQNLSAMAVDDVTGDVVYINPGANQITVDTQAGGTVCFFSPNMSSMSSVAAHGGYMVFTDPTENKVGWAKVSDCSGYTTTPIAGQPWSVAMTGTGSGLAAYVLSRDTFSSGGKPGITKIAIPTGTTNSVELANFPAISTIRNTTPYEGVNQIIAFQKTPYVAALFMADQTDGQVAIVNTNTMAVTYVPVTELPFALTPDETGTKPDGTTMPVLWVSYILAAGGENVTHIGEINLSSGAYSANKGACATGILAGGSVVTSTVNGTSQFVCAMGNTIAAPVTLQP